MERPLDLDHFFKEQEDRMNASDSDFLNPFTLISPSKSFNMFFFETRLLYRRKRELQRLESVAAAVIAEESTSLFPPSLSQIGRETDAAMKKRKLVEKVGSVRSVNEFETLQNDPRQQGVSVNVPGPSTSSATAPDQRTVSFVQERIRSVPSQHTPSIPPQDLSNITTPPSNTGSTSPLKQQVLPKPKPSKPISEAVPVIKKRPTTTKVSETKVSTSTGNSTRLVKTISGSALNRRRKTKKPPEDKEALMTPMEYAAILHEKWQGKVSSTPPEQLFLKDCTIFIVFEEKNKSSKDTRIKLDIIARNGGKVATSYEPANITHIIPGGSTITKKKILRAIGLKSIDDIPPHIRTVNWDWIVSGLTRNKRASETMYELWKERLLLYAGVRMPNNQSGASSKGKGKEIETDVPPVEEFSVIEDFSVDISLDKQNKKRDSLQDDLNTSATSSKVTINNSGQEEKEDPLLPFYAKAREEAEYASADEYRPLSATNDSRTSKLKGFQCDTKTSSVVSNESPNWDVIEKLAELKEMHRELGTEGDKWRVLSYQKAIGSLKTYPTRIKSKEEAMELRGISSKTADKIMEIIRTGELQRIKFTKTPELDSIRIFRGIYGVGSNIARKWVAQGVKSLEDLNTAVAAGKIKLTFVQEIGLRHYDDINDRMPRQEAAEIFIKIKELALTLDSKLSLEIMGSFRRGKTTCGDIDILLTRPTDDGKTHSGILKPLYNTLKKRGILCEDLALPDDWNSLECTYRGLCCKNESSRRRRIDILCIPFESRGAARIYYTGDDIFNRSIRLKANKMGMSLNQRGLFQGVVRDIHDRTKKLCPGSLLCSDSERKIFEILGVPWQEAHERVRS